MKHLMLLILFSFVFSNGGCNDNQAMQSSKSGTNASLDHERNQPTSNINTTSRDMTNETSAGELNEIANNPAVSSIETETQAESEQVSVSTAKPAQTSPAIRNSESLQATVTITGGGKAKSVYVSDLEPRTLHVASDEKENRAKIVTDYISVNGVPSRHGLFTHPPQGFPARVVYDVGKRYQRLRGAVAVNDTVKKNGGRSVKPMVFQIIGDDILLW